MSTQTKTAGKTATKSEIGMKGVQDIRRVVNDHIININRLHHTRVEIYTDKEIADYLERKGLEELALHLGQVHNALVNTARDAYKIALAEEHPSEKAPKKESNLEQQSKAMRETSKKATAQTRAKINKELYKQLREEQKATAKKGGE